jgi:hypothetical protein
MAPRTRAVVIMVRVVKGSKIRIQTVATARLAASRRDRISDFARTPTSIAGRDLGMSVDVDLRDHRPARALVGDFFERTGERLTWTAPRRPEVDEHRMLPGGGENVGLE